MRHSAAPRPDSYPSHQPWDIKSTIVYGPVKARRLGWSLGINLLPPNGKLCTFNCVYCQVGWTTEEYPQLQARGLRFPSLEEIRTEVDARLRELTVAGAPPETITLSGNGEPTLYPDFAGAVEILIASRDAHAPKAKLGVLTAGTELGRADIRAACDRLDERYVKCDAGDAHKFHVVDLPRVPFTLDQLVEGSRGLRDHVVQAMFITGRIDNTDDASVEAWAGVVERMRPKSVQVYSLARVPPAPGLVQVSRERLRAIADRCRAVTGIPAEVF